MFVYRKDEMEVELTETEPYNSLERSHQPQPPDPKPIRRTITETPACKSLRRPKAETLVEEKPGHCNLSPHHQGSFQQQQSFENDKYKGDMELYPQKYLFSSTTHLGTNVNNAVRARKKHLSDSKRLTSSENDSQQASKQNYMQQHKKLLTSRVPSNQRPPVDRSSTSQITSQGIFPHNLQESSYDMWLHPSAETGQDSICNASVSSNNSAVLSVDYDSCSVGGKDEDCLLLQSSPSDSPILKGSQSHDTPSLKLAYPYQEDQWSSVNPNGKKRYSLEFLKMLQGSPLAKVPVIAAELSPTIITKGGLFKIPETLVLDYFRGKGLTNHGHIASVLSSHANPTGHHGEKGSSKNLYCKRCGNRKDLEAMTGSNKTSLENSLRNEKQPNLSDIFQAQEKQFEMLREMIEAGFARSGDPIIKDLPESFIIYMDSLKREYLEKTVFRLDNMEETLKNLLTTVDALRTLSPNTMVKSPITSTSATAQQKSAKASLDTGIPTKVTTRILQDIIVPESSVGLHKTIPIGQKPMVYTDPVGTSREPKILEEKAFTENVISNPTRGLKEIMDELDYFLGELNDLNFNRISKAIVALVSEVEIEKVMKDIVCVIHNKAVSSHSSAILCAKMCKMVYEKTVLRSDRTRQTTFGKILLNKCRNILEGTEGAPTEIISGNTRFIAELFKRKMIKIDLMNQFLSKLFHLGEFDDIDGLCSLIFMIGKSYDQEYKSQVAKARKMGQSPRWGVKSIEAFMDQLKEFGEKETTQSCAKFSITMCELTFKQQTCSGKCETCSTWKNRLKQIWYCL